MTPDELRELADAQPVAWMHADDLRDQDTFPCVARFREHLSGDPVPLFTHPAPAAPQAEPKRELSEKQIADACLRYRHDFGLLDKYERDCIVNEAWRWADAFRIGGSDAE